MKNKNLGHKNYYDSDFNLINGLINGYSNHQHGEIDFAEKELPYSNMI